MTLFLEGYFDGVFSLLEAEKLFHFLLHFRRHVLYPRVIYKKEPDRVRSPSFYLAYVNPIDLDCNVPVIAHNIERCIDVLGHRYLAADQPSNRCSDDKK